MSKHETRGEWMPVQQATRKYGLSRATLYRLVAEGRVRRAKRAGDARAYVSAADLSEATTLRVVRSPRARPRWRG